MNLDGILFQGTLVRVGRFPDYNPTTEVSLCASHSSPHINLTTMGLTPGEISGVDWLDRVFVRGISSPIE